MQVSVNAKRPTNIYKVTNLVNGKSYVGQTCLPLPRRMQQHWHSANVKKLANPFHKALRKYGKDAFVSETLVICEEQMANYYEHGLIEIHDTYASKMTGYNVANPLDHIKSITVRKCGEEHHMAKLKDADVLEIRNSTHLSHLDIAEKYGIKYASVKRIRSGRNWKNVGGVRHFSEYKKDICSGENHPNSIVSDEVRAIIKSDVKTNTNVLANRLGIGKHVITSIRGAQPQIAKLRVIPDSVAQYVLDNPDIPHVRLGKQLNISEATISRIKAGKQFGHLKSNATDEQWAVFYKRQEHSTGKLRS
jgi:hypothetical protein